MAHERGLHGGPRIAIEQTQVDAMSRNELLIGDRSDRSAEDLLGERELAMQLRRVDQSQDQAFLAMIRRARRVVVPRMQRDTQQDTHDLGIEKGMHVADVAGIWKDLVRKHAIPSIGGSPAAPA